MTPLPCQEITGLPLSETLTESTVHYSNDERKERARIYRLLSVKINSDARVPKKADGEADRIFYSQIVPRLSLNGRKLPAKRRFFRYLFHAGMAAVHCGGCVRYSRNNNTCSVIELQVIEAFIDADYFTETRSPKGSPCMSRLVPTTKLVALASGDPWDYDDPSGMTQYVFLRSRKKGRNKGENLDFDLTLPVPADVQRRLTLVNADNAGHKMTCLKESPRDPDSKECLRLRPIHLACFTQDFDLHGRIYTGLYGHQSLSKTERATIRIDDCRTVELDYSGLHPRMLYHLAEMDYRGDPYALWGKGTTKAHRLMAKLAFNALINAITPAKAVAGCNHKANRCTNSKDAKGRRITKSGKALEKALRLQEAMEKTGSKFKEVCQDVIRHHKPIAHLLGKDQGIKLMRIDSKIALDILHHFAEKGIPCLGVHDSFIVQEQHKDELRQIMHDTYRKHIGHNPIIK
jgi:hypothetical protein